MKFEIHVSVPCVVIINFCLLDRRSFANKISSFETNNNSLRLYIVCRSTHHMWVNEQTNKRTKKKAIKEQLKMQRRMTDQKKKKKMTDFWVVIHSHWIYMYRVFLRIFTLIFNKRYLIKNPYDTLDRKIKIKIKKKNRSKNYSNHHLRVPLIGREWYDSTPTCSITVNDRFAFDQGEFHFLSLTIVYKLYIHTYTEKYINETMAPTNIFTYFALERIEREERIDEEIKSCLIIVTMRR